MNDSLSEMQSFEVEPFKIDFTKPAHVIRQEILKLPLADQQVWIDKWMEQPDIQADLERKRKSVQEIKAPPQINTYKKVDPAANWTD